MKFIQLKTAIPGPKAQAILARRAAALPNGLAKSTEVVVAKAEDALIWDVDGNQLLDMAGGIGTINVGHRPDAVVKAAKKQLDKYIHTCSLVTTTEPYIALAEMLNEVTPGDFPKKTLMACSGSEAVENAVLIARYHTKRSHIICFEGAYHGRTLLTLTMTSKYGLFKKGFGSFSQDIVRLPAPYAYRRPKGMSDADYEVFCCETLDRALIAQVDPSAVAAIIIEPVQGEGGFIAMPHYFLQKIRQICDTHGIVMIADEIQSGFGRTGKLFAIEHSGVVPDMITMAKSLGAGFPISAVTGRADMMDSPHLGGVGGTYGGSPVGCAAAIETIKIINSPAFLAKANRMGEIMRSTLDRWADNYELIGEVRGVGPMQLVEFVKDRESRAPDMDISLEIIKDCVANGLVMIRAGLYSNCIRLLPPIVMTDEQLHEALSVMEGAIHRAHAKRGMVENIVAI